VDSVGDVSLVANKISGVGVAVGFCVCARAECACSQPCPQDWREVQMNPGICTVGRTFCFACMHLPMCPEAPTTYPGASVK